MTRTKALFHFFFSFSFFHMPSFFKTLFLHRARIIAAGSTGHTPSWHFTLTGKGFFQLQLNKTGWGFWLSWHASWASWKSLAGGPKAPLDSCGMEVALSSSHVGHMLEESNFPKEERGAKASLRELWAGQPPNFSICFYYSEMGLTPLFVVLWSFSL